MNHHKPAGANYVDWVRRCLLTCDCTAPSDRAQAVEWAAWQMHCLLQPLQEFARYEVEKQNRAPSSTTLAGMQATLKRLGGHLPTNPATPEQVKVAIEQALKPSALPPELQGVRLHVEVIGLRPGAEFYPRLVVRLQGVQTWTLYCLDCAGLDGAWNLSEATAHLLPNGILLTGSEGVLKFSGTCIFVPGFSDDLRSTTIENVHNLPQAVVRRINLRARWDYELEGSDGDLALRGTSDYDLGCCIQFLGVANAQLPMRFSHAVFRLLPPRYGWHGLSIGITSEVGSSDSQEYWVACQALRFSDDDGPDTSASLESALYGLDSDPLPLAIDPGLLHGLEGPDETPEGRALWATRPFWPVAKPVRSTPGAAALARSMLDALQSRDSLPDLEDPFLSEAAQQAQICGARDLLKAAFSLTGDESLRRDFEQLPDGQPGPRLLEEAHAALLQELVRRQFGLPPKQIVLDLETLTVGRILSEPPGLSHQEKLAFAAYLAVIDQSRELSLEVLLPDPEARLRLKEMACELREWLSLSGSSRGPTNQGGLEAAVLHLARHGRLDCAELTFLLDQDPALPWYLVLRALLQGHPVFPST